jgi:hypothetical protein
VADHRAEGAEGTGGAGTPVPRDLPDQQVTEGEDRWDVAPGGTAGQDTGEESAAQAPDDVPDTDEAGTGRRGGAPHSGAADPDQPVPDEPTG